jgi:hemerythrin-like domain-containing protein
MTAPVELWHAEHRDFERLLDLLQKEVAVFHRGGHPNYELMFEIVQYLRHYPDRLHHPREEVAFKRLISRDPTCEPRVAALEQEHRVIAAAGDALLKFLEEIMKEALVPRAKVEFSAATYLVYYRLHIAREEEDVLPLAARLLTPEDWKAIAAAVPPGPDPLFGEHPETRFRELRRRIASESTAPD